MTVESDLVRDSVNELLFFRLAVLDLLAVLGASIHALHYSGQVFVAKLPNGSSVHGVGFFLDLIEGVHRSKLLLQEVVDAALLLDEVHVFLDSGERVRVGEALGDVSKVLL